MNLPAISRAETIRSHAAILSRVPASDLALLGEDNLEDFESHLVGLIEALRHTLVGDEETDPSHGTTSDVEALETYLASADKSVTPPGTTTRTEASDGFIGSSDFSHAWNTLKERAKMSRLTGVRLERSMGGQPWRKMSAGTRAEMLETVRAYDRTAVPGRFRLAVDVTA